MDGVQLPQDYRATIRWQFTFYHQVPRNFMKYKMKRNPNKIILEIL